MSNFCQSSFRIDLKSFVTSGLSAFTLHFQVTRCCGQMLSQICEPRGSNLFLHRLYSYAIYLRLRSNLTFWASVGCLFEGVVGGIEDSLRFVFAKHITAPSAEHAINSKQIVGAHEIHNTRAVSIVGAFIHKPNSSATFYILHCIPRS